MTQRELDRFWRDCYRQAVETYDMDDKAAHVFADCKTRDFASKYDIEEA